MKKRLTLAAALILAFALTVTGFAGCAPTENKSIADADAPSSAPATPDVTEPDTADGVTFTIGLTQIADHGSLNMCKRGVLDALADLGYEEGGSLRVLFQNAQGELPIATTIAQQFVADKVDVIVAIATPSAQAAYAASMGSIPVVFTAVSDPVAAELANDDGTNVAGVTGTNDKLPVDATFQLIKDLVPGAAKVGILHNTGEVNSDIQLAAAQEQAAGYGMEIVDAGITSTNEIASALDTLLPQVDVIMNLTDNMVVSSLPLLVQKCNEAKIPLFGSEETQVTGGALASAGLDYYALGRITGDMVAKVLEGTPAEQLPIASMDVPVLTVNSDQLALLGLTVPESIAGQVTLVTTEAAEDTES